MDGEMILLIVVCIIACILAVLVGRAITSLSIKWIIYSKKLKPDTSIKLSQKEIGESYTLYSYIRTTFWGKEEPNYILITRHNLGKNKQENIAKQKPFVDGVICFVSGPKWSQGYDRYEKGIEEVKDIPTPV